MKLTFVAWTRFDHRSHLLASELGARIHFIHFGQRGRVLQAPIRYLIQGLRTWRVLRIERPDVVLTQNPPIFCALLVFVFCRLYQVKYVIDSHTGAFLSLKWRPFLLLHRWLSRNALTTIVHNVAQEQAIRTWGCQYVVMIDPIVPYPIGENVKLDGQFNVVVINTFAEDEPINAVLGAASLLPDFEFYVSGDVDLASKAVVAKPPTNCHFTGFVPYGKYIGLLRAADVIVDLTTRDHTLLCGAFEAVALGKPLITSDWPILRERFNSGVVHVPNTAEGIRQGLRRVRANRGALENDILSLRSVLESEWSVKLRELKTIISLGPTRPMEQRPT